MASEELPIEAAAKVLRAELDQVRLRDEEWTRLARDVVAAADEARGMTVEYRKAMDHPQGILTGDWRYISDWIPNG